MATSPCVAGFAATDSAGAPIQFTVGTDIVDHFESARMFGRGQLADPTAHGRFQRRVVALPDRRGRVTSPMLLTLASNSELLLVRRDHLSGAEWSSTPLLPPPPEGGRSPRVRAVGATATADDRIAIAVAVDDGTTPGASGSRVLLAFDLSSRSTDWSAIPWIDCGQRSATGDGPTPGHVWVEAIRVLDDGDGTWTVVLAGADGPNDTVHLLRSADPDRTFADALVFTPAVTLDELLDFEAGVHPVAGSGLYVLGTSGGSRVLTFRPFPTYGPGGTMSNVPPVVLLPAPEGANVLETGRTTPDGTDLHIGGEGVQQIAAGSQEDADQARFVDVIGPDAASGTVDVVVSEGDGPPTVWALGADGGLTVVTRLEQGTWSNPLRLRSGIVEIAPVGGDEHHSACLVVVRGDGTAAQLWRDIGTGAWQETPILVADPEDVTAITCYGTVVRVLDDAGFPQPGVKVRATASVLSSVSINGSASYLGPEVAAECTTDANGAVCIYDRVRCLTPATYRLEFGDLGRTLDVNPAATAHRRFREVTGDELRGAVATPLQGNGTPLLPDEFTVGARRDEVDVLAATLHQGALLTTATDGPVDGVRIVDGGGPTRPAAPFSSVFHAGAVTPGYRWGIQTGAAGVTALDHHAVSGLVGAAADAERFFVGLGDSVADFFEGLPHRIEEGIRVVLHAAEDAYEFVCEIAGRVRRWTLQTLEQAGAFFTWLWAQVETTLEKVWEWLKFIVDWQDILRVRNAMVAAAGKALDFVHDEIGSLAKTVSQGFDDVLAQIDSWQGDGGGHSGGKGVAAGAGPAPALAQSAHDVMSALTSGAGDALHAVTGNCVVGWVMHRLDDVLGEVVRIEGLSPIDRIADATADFVSGLMADELATILDSVEQVGQDLVRLFEGKVPGAHGISWEAVGETFAAVGTTALRALVLGIRSVVLRAVDLLGELILAFRDVLFVRIEFPFVEKLAGLVGWHLDTSFRFIDGLMLLAALPATIAYKIIYGRAPVRKGDVLELPFGSVTAQADPLTGAILGLVGTFLKFGVGSYHAAKTTWELAVGSRSPMSGDTARLVQAVGTGFKTVGWVAEILAMHHRRGKAVSGIESAMVCVTGVSVLLATSLGRHEQRGQQADLDARKALAGVELGLRIVHLGLRAADFGVLMDQDLETASANDTLFESGMFVESVLDHLGAGLLEGLVLAEEADLTTRSVIAASAAFARGGALGVGIGRVVALSLTE